MRGFTLPIKNISDTVLQNDSLGVPRVVVHFIKNNNVSYIYTHTVSDWSVF